MTVINNNWNSYCGCTERVSPCNTVFQKVDELPQLGDATRNHGYTLPDNTVWVVNSDGTGFAQLNGGGTGGAPYDDTAIKERLDSLEGKVDNDTIYDDSELRNLIQGVADRNTMEDNRLVNIENKNAKQDERLTALENASGNGSTAAAIHSEMLSDPKEDSQNFIVVNFEKLAENYVRLSAVVDTRPPRLLGYEKNIPYEHSINVNYMIKDVYPNFFADNLFLVTDEDSIYLFQDGEDEYVSLKKEGDDYIFTAKTSHEGVRTYSAIIPVTTLD